MVVFLKVSIISGSQRKNSNSSKVALRLKDYFLDTKEEKITSYLFCLDEVNLPLWDESLSEEVNDKWGSISEKLQESDAFIFVSPEWHGMVPAALKNFFLYIKPNEVAHKPALIVTVSAGMGGAYPVNELRTSSYKNSRICYIPEHIIIRNVNQYLDPNEQENKFNKHLNERISETTQLLLDYAKALKNMRKTYSFNFEKFPNGL